jgi:hypothetical protein
MNWFEPKLIKGQEAYYTSCEDCGTRPYTSYMVKREIWPKDKKSLCLCCLSKRLGRSIELSDFRPCQMTNLIWLGYMLAKGETPDLAGF